VKKIGTHDGTFHCDEALACFLLRLTQEFKNADVVRTRDQKVLDDLPIIVDVGAVYDPSKHRYDHHQRGFTETLSKNHKTKLSSAGLIYKHFGEEILKTLTHTLSLSLNDLKILFNKIYESFIEGIDGIDNGILQYPAEITPAYHINTDLSSRVGNLNPAWNEKDIDVNLRFKDAMELTGKEFVQAVHYAAKSWMPARNIVKTAYDERKKYHSSGQIVVLNEYTVWSRHLLDIEDENKNSGLIKYVLFPDDSSKKWRVQAVPSATKFVNRKSLPQEWRGLRAENLSKVTNIPGCVFVHASGFIGGNDTFKGALAMAAAALEHSDEPQAKKQKADDL